MSEVNPINELSGHVFRENSGKMVAYLCKLYGLKHIDAISDIVQDTFEAALNKWKYGGLPNNPPAWLMTVAKNKAINYFKKAQKTDLIDFFITLDSSTPHDEILLHGDIEDSQLRLLLSCCHPELSEKNQIILTLTVLCGFGNQEIASALLMKEEAVKKALMRSKKHLREEIKDLEPLLELDDPQRVHVIQTVLYLMFNEGYKRTNSSQLINHDLCYESMRLAKLLLTTKTALSSETYALLALQFFTAARFPSRIDDQGSIVLLKNQNRTLWNQTLIKEGHYYLEKAKEESTISKYLLEAAISSLHCLAPSFKTTPWEIIVPLYDQLYQLQPSPMTLLNKIVALSYDKGANAGLQELELIKDSKELKDYYLLYSAEGDMLSRINKPNLAIRAFKKALQLARNNKEKELLNSRINDLRV